MSFAALEIGRKALMAQKFGLDVTSNNIANVNTEGYSRRSVVLNQTNPISTQGQFKGTGVISNKLKTYREDFFDREIRDTFSRRFGLESDGQIYQRLETIMMEPSEENINDNITNFFKAFDEMALKPESVGLRENLIEIGRGVVDKFNYISQQMMDAKRDIAKDIYFSVDRANSLIGEIAGYNGAFSANRSLASNESITMIDEREKIIEDLAKIGDVKITNNEDGTVNVYMNGINLVTKDQSNFLSVQENVDEQSGEITFSLALVDKKGNVLSNVKPNSGELSSMLLHYNKTLDASDSSGEFSLYGRLNDYATAFVENVNSISQRGFGLDDKTNVVPGRKIFEIEKANGLVQMTLSKDIDGRPRDIPLASAPSEPGDGTIAREIARLADIPDFIGLDSFTEYYAAMIGKLGAISQESNNMLSNISLVSEQLESQRESIIGVNLDEEAINLMKYQKAFEAAARVITSTSEMLSTVINLGR